MMKEIITIENTEMQIREYVGQRVVTFKDIDTVHQNKSGTAKRNFIRNKKHFIENEDFIIATRGLLKGDNLSLLNIDVPTRGITLLTESGYLLIAKSFTDDLSWKVQRQLINIYFGEKSSQKQLTLEEMTDFPEYPKQIYQTTSTPAPKNPSWYNRNKRRMFKICEKVNAPLTKLYHHILLRLGEEYDLDKANEIYMQEVGHAPKYALDIATYFPELGRMADDFLDQIEKIQSE